jgi:hypothetical protein
MCPTRTPRLPHEAPWSAAEAAWLAELRAARCASLELVSHLQVLVAQAKFSRLDACMAVACLVMNFMSAYMSGCAAGMAAREQWMEEIVASAGALKLSPDADDTTVHVRAQAQEARPPIFVFGGPPASVVELAGMDGGEGGGAASGNAS